MNHWIIKISRWKFQILKFIFQTHFQIKQTWSSLEQEVLVDEGNSKKVFFFSKSTFFYEKEKSKILPCDFFTRESKHFSEKWEILENNYSMFNLFTWYFFLSIHSSPIFHKFQSLFREWRTYRISIEYQILWRGFHGAMFRVEKKIKINKITTIHSKTSRICLLFAKFRSAGTTHVKLNDPRQRIFYFISIFCN